MAGISYRKFHRALTITVLIFLGVLIVAAATSYLVLSETSRQWLRDIDAISKIENGYRDYWDGNRQWPGAQPGLALEYETVKDDLIIHAYYVGPLAGHNVYYCLYPDGKITFKTSLDPG